MTALGIYKFYHGKLEYHWNARHDNDDVNDVVLFIDNDYLEEFMELIKSFLRNRDDGLECYMKEKYICVWMDEVCEYYDIKLTDVFPK
jgi:hypothetical protein